LDLGGSQRLPLSAHDPFSASHFFAINAAAKESLQRVTQFTTPAAATESVEITAGESDAENSAWAEPVDQSLANELSPWDLK
jgi:hypothetical protein